MCNEKMLTFTGRGTSEGLTSMVQDQTKIEPLLARIPLNSRRKGCLAVWKGRGEAHSGAGCHPWQAKQAAPK